MLTELLMLLMYKEHIRPKNLQTRSKIPPFAQYMFVSLAYGQQLILLSYPLFLIDMVSLSSQLMEFVLVIFVKKNTLLIKKNKPVLNTIIFVYWY